MLLFCQTLKQIKQFQQNNLFVFKFDMLEKQISIANILLTQKPITQSILQEQTSDLGRFYGIALPSSTDQTNSTINRML